MRSHTKILLPLLFLIFAVSTASVSAQTDWKKIGDENVNFTVDHDSIDVNDDSRIRELRMSIKNAPINFKRIVVHYKDGQKQELDFMENVAMNSDARVIQLAGDGHVIDRVEYWYETASLGGKKAHITLYGRSGAPMPVSTTVITTTTTPGAAVVTTPSVVTAPTAVTAPVTVVTSDAVVAPGPDKWRKLGDEVVNFDVDHDTIDVNDDNRIRELRINVADAPVRFRRIVITYKDGVKKDMEYMEDIAMGRDGRLISLEGDGHIIDAVEFWYETASMGGKKAHITLYGRS